MWPLAVLHGLAMTDILLSVFSDFVAVRADCFLFWGRGPTGEPSSSGTRLAKCCSRISYERTRTSNVLISVNLQKNRQVTNLQNQVPSTNRKYLANAKNKPSKKWSIQIKKISSKRNQFYFTDGYSRRLNEFYFTHKYLFLKAKSIVIRSTFPETCIQIA